jgi:polysaccharide deacetylase family protein (PEP-CTERM system associated)
MSDLVPALLRRAEQPAAAAAWPGPGGPATVLSFDVEEHHRIEAAAGLRLPPGLRRHYRRRLDDATRWLLDQLAAHGLRATFFIVGQVARHSPALVRAVHRAGHEVASHGWDHTRLHALTPAAFRADLRQSKDALEQLTGEAVGGYRAPTFSVTGPTAWALDELAEAGLAYDSSIYPVRHDRYGVPAAPRTPFWAAGRCGRVLELPPATLRLGGVNLPVGGGGYFRLLPLFLLEWSLRQVRRGGRPPVAVLYFHPWEFDPGQPRLPLGPLNRFRTYVGLGRARPRLEALLGRHRFARAIDVVRQLEKEATPLPTFSLTGEGR